MAFLDSVAMGFCNTFDYRGHACRSEFWWFVLLQLLFGTLIFLISPPPDLVERIYVSGISTLFFFPPMLSLTVRRVRDAGGWPWLVALYCLFIATGVVLTMTFSQGLVTAIMSQKAGAGGGFHPDLMQLGPVDMAGLAAAAAAFLAGILTSLLIFAYTLLPSR